MHDAYQSDHGSLKKSYRSSAPLSVCKHGMVFVDRYSKHRRTRAQQLSSAKRNLRLYWDVNHIRSVCSGASDVKSWHRLDDRSYRTRRYRE
jgi:hypothetical protein